VTCPRTAKLDEIVRVIVFHLSKEERTEVAERILPDRLAKIEEEKYGKKKEGNQG
jgi:predicted GTPase